MIHGNRLMTAAAIAALCATGQYGIANASPTFDVEAYSDCTAVAITGPPGDDLVTSCCVQQAGTPTATRYGMGCVAPVDNPAPDYRPTIILPARPAPPEEDQDALDQLIEMPIPQQPFDESAPLP